MYTQGLPRGKSAPSFPAKVPFRFLMVPDAIASRKDLSPGGKLLFGVILSLSRARDRSCWLCNASLAERTGLCLKQVKRLLGELEGLSLIDRRMHGQHRIEIVVKWEGGDNLSLHVGTQAPDDPGTKCPRKESGKQSAKPVGSPGDEDAALPPDEAARRLRAIVRPGG
jgi:hypothetical protein